MYDLFTSQPAYLQGMEVVAICSLLITLSIATYTDLKDRTVPTQTWGPISVIVILLTVTRLYVTHDPLSVIGMTIINISTGFIIGYVVFRLGQLGFADCIAFAVIGGVFAVPITLLAGINDTMPVLSPPLSYLYLPIAPIVGIASALVLVRATMTAMTNLIVVRFEDGTPLATKIYLLFTSKQVEVTKLHEKFGRILLPEDTVNSSTSTLIKETHSYPRAKFLSHLVEWSDENNVSMLSIDLVKHVPSELQDWEIINANDLGDYVKEIQQYNTVYVTTYHPFMLYLLTSVLLYLIIGDLIHIILTVLI